MTAEILLVCAVAAVGVLHTMVPDHWVPIALVARQCGWTRTQTARAAFTAGSGHVISTLLIGLAVWIAGVAFAARFGNVADLVSSIGLIGFGLWIALSSARELSQEAARERALREDRALEEAGERHDGGQREEVVTRQEVHAQGPAAGGGPMAVLTRHRHIHGHADGTIHIHQHEHGPDTVHEITDELELAPPLHVHDHRVSGRTALLLILGSSPMVEGIPAFFAAAKYGIGLIGVMAVVFAAATIATYVALCVYSTAKLESVSIGPLERYGEVFSGAFIML